MRLGLGLQIGDVDIAFSVACHDDDFHPCHHRAGGIGAVGGLRDEADVAMALPAVTMIFMNDEQPRVFSLRSGIGLQGNPAEPGDFGQPILQLLE